MFSRLTTGKHSFLASSRAGSKERPQRFQASPKHLRMILLHRPTTKCPGMIFLQDASIRSGTRKRTLLHNSIRICTLKDKNAQGAVAAKRLRMISLQNQSNKTPGIISLQKKVGGGDIGALLVPNPFPVRTSPPRTSRHERLPAKRLPTGCAFRGAQRRQELRGDHKVELVRQRSSLCPAASIALQFRLFIGPRFLCSQRTRRFFRCPCGQHFRCPCGQH